MSDPETDETVGLPPLHELATGVGHVVVNAEAEAQPVATAEQPRLLTAATDLVSALVDQYPQTNEAGELNYAIAGSFAVMLLSQAEHIEVLDAARIPAVVVTGEIAVPDSAAKALQAFARAWGDLDYVSTPQYDRVRLESQRTLDSDPAAYDEARAKYLFKGPAEITEPPEAPTDVDAPPTDSVFVEELDDLMDSRTIRIQVQGKDFYIVDPRILAGLKTAHLLEGLNNDRSPGKYVTDLTVLLSGLVQIYTDEELLDASHDALMRYAPSNVNALNIPYRNRALTPALTGWIERAIAQDNDATYLEQLQFGRERAVGVLKILHNYETPEAKQAIVDAMNSHRELIDVQEVDLNSEQTIAVMAAFLDAHPDLLTEHMKGWASDGAAERASMGTAAWLRTSRVAEFVKSFALSVMDDREDLDYKPSNSEYLRILAHLDEASDLGRQLDAVDQILGRAELPVKQLAVFLENNTLQDAGMKQALMRGLVAAAEQLGDGRLAAVVDELASWLVLQSKWMVSSGPSDGRTALEAQLRDLGVSMVASQVP
ncbi:MAG TPA: hypothetical protein VLE99_06735 [Candidatus Saccharimonadales bacterium]|nr:hypothetical protein [Candidatus Saccharimonadales bacterium]